MDAHPAPGSQQVHTLLVLKVLMCESHVFPAIASQEIVPLINHVAWKEMRFASVTESALARSVLWLLRFPPYGERHIHTEAAARGIDPSRIIFTDVAAKPVRRVSSIRSAAVHGRAHRRFYTKTHEVKDCSCLTQRA